MEGEREAEIFSATRQLLVEYGYDRLTLAAVASAAKASKATLYRRWSGKADLVIDAVAGGGADRVIDTGSLRGDLMAAAETPGDLADDLPGMIGALVAALHRDAELTEAFRTRFLEPKLTQTRTIFERARDRGEVAGQADLQTLGSILPALCSHEAFLFGVQTTPERIRQIIDEVVLPACRATLDSDS
ncbi:TetR/AcrR family transcriptional regulator [Microlunatus panaciterrae]